jgi:hypothetical protein
MLLGRIESGMENLKEINRNFFVIVERMKQQKKLIKNICI